MTLANQEASEKSFVIFCYIQSDWVKSKIMKKGIRKMSDENAHS